MGQMLGYIYAVFLIMSNFGKKSSQILLLQTISFLFKSFHYYLLGGVSGFLSSFVSMIRNLLFYKIKSNFLWTIIFIIIYFIIGFITYKNVYTLLPLLATTIYTIIINYDNPCYLRMGMFVTSITWLIYNFYIVSYSGIIIQIVMLIMNAIAIFKLDKKRLF